jgi:Heterokaryon incompatibility protein (HET)
MKDKNWSPTRLLDVSLPGPNSENLIGLVIVANSPQREDYVTLSYCWGEKPSFTKLLSKNLSTFQTGFALNILPKSFVDAVHITRRLGLRYLWIDALCIIQDSEADWLQESLSMSKVYAHAALNIAAAASCDAQGGVYRDRNSARLNGCDLTLSWTNVNRFYRHSLPGPYHISLRNLWDIMLSRSPLHQRAWTFQERLLARRTLHFADDQVYWECSEKVASELTPQNDIWTTKHYSYPLSPSTHLKLCFESIRQHDDISKFFRLWYDLVEAYSACKLTYGSDKLIAFSGVVAEAAGVYKAEDYLAGLWRSSLPLSLLWRAGPGALGVQHYRAPTWSWASMDGPVSHDAPHVGVPLAEIVDVSVATEQGPLGPVTNGHLVIKGGLCKITLRANNEPGGHILGSTVPILDSYGDRVVLEMDNRNHCDGQLYDEEIVFYLPLAHSLSPYKRVFGKQVSWYDHVWALLLEPVSGIKGRFRRIGCVRFRGRILSKGYRIDKIMSSYSKPDSYAPIQRAFAAGTIEEEYYKDFDGVDKYTVEIV